MGPERREKREDRLPLLERDIGHLPAVAAVPAEGRTLEALRFLVTDEQAELEGISKADVLELSRGG